MYGGDSSSEASARRYDPAARATVRASSAGVLRTGGFAEGLRPPPAPTVNALQAETAQVARQREQALLDAQEKIPSGIDTTADALRSERATGQRTGGRWHTMKGREYVRALREWLRRNPGAPQLDRTLAQYLLNDLGG